LKRFSFTVAAATTLSAASVAWAGAAEAAPTAGGSAADAVKELQAAGYHVQTNGGLTDLLSSCATTGKHRTPATAGLPGPNSGPLPFTTIYLDVLCPGAH
jgi:hypothetical protein